VSSRLIRAFWLTPDPTPHIAIQPGLRRMRHQRKRQILGRKTAVHGRRQTDRGRTQEWLDDGFTPRGLLRFELLLTVLENKRLRVKRLIERDLGDLQDSKWRSGRPRLRTEQHTLFGVEREKVLVRAEP
jgi:hypothetical protein